MLGIRHVQVRAHRIASVDSHVGPTIQRYVEENYSRKTVEALGDSLLSSQESPLFFLTTYLRQAPFRTLIGWQRLNR